MTTKGDCVEQKRKGKYFGADKGKGTQKISPSNTTDTKSTAPNAPTEI